MTVHGHALRRLKMQIRLCTRCNLGSQPNVIPVPGRGMCPARLVVLGMAPGRLENEEGKPFCLEESTRVLTADLRWVPIGDIQQGDELLAPDEEGEENGAGASKRGLRRWRVARVGAVRHHTSEVLSIGTEDGELELSADHKVLTRQDGGKATGRWVEASELHLSDGRASKLSYVVPPWRAPTTFDEGWLAGFFDGDGHIGPRPGRRGSWNLGYSQNKGPTSDLAKQRLRNLHFRHAVNSEQRNNGVELEHVVIRGGFKEHLRFLGATRPQRLLKRFDQLVRAKPPVVHAKPSRLLWKERLTRKANVVDIHTSTGTFIAEGFIVHNCGPAGHLLNKALTEAGFDPNALAYVSAINCWPPDNREPTQTEMASCRPWLLDQLMLYRPERILVLGNVALRAFFGGTANKDLKIGQVKGRVMAWRPSEHGGVDWQQEEVLLFPTYHPAAALRASKLYDEIVRDIAEIKAFATRDSILVPTSDGRRRDTCVLCKPKRVMQPKVGEELDEWGLPYCRDHAGKQGSLL